MDVNRAWEQQRVKPGTLIRYADDFVILCPSRVGRGGPPAGGSDARPRSGCRLRPAKKSVVCLTRGVEGFDLLAFHHHKVES